ncbi:MAG: error-prone DNA polymerase, partial [Woeseia sp.]|nr:error-prone DNA polymerase [Woeseia sp.]
QPMGFYSASQLTQDLRRHGVEIRAVDVNGSGWDNSLERAQNGAAAMRIGLRQIKGLSETAGQRLVAARAAAPFISVQQLSERACLNRSDLSALAAAGALAQIDGHRHKARWHVAGVEAPTPLFTSMERYEPAPLLKKPTEGQDIVADYRSLGLTLGRHPLALLRDTLGEQQFLQARDLPELASGRRVRVAGLVITKQRPGTASGVTFVTLEDESGHTNLVVWKKTAETQRSVLLNAQLMGVDGELQKEGKVIHVIAHRLLDYSALLGELRVRSRDFH